MKKRKNPIVAQKEKSVAYEDAKNQSMRIRKKHHMTIKKEERQAFITETGQTLYGEGKSLEDLGARECRWPVGDVKDGTVLFCGAPIEKGSYCCNHARIAYRPAPKKKDSGEE